MSRAQLCQSPQAAESSRKTGRLEDWTMEDWKLEDYKTGLWKTLGILQEDWKVGRCQEHHTMDNGQWNTGQLKTRNWTIIRLDIVNDWNT